MQIHVLEIDNSPSHPIEEQIKGTLKDVYNFLTKNYFNKTDFETLEDIKNEGVNIKSYDHREFDILNGKALKFKHNRIIIGYIIISYKGFKFKTGKPSDAQCLSWDFETFNEALNHATEYINNYKNI